MTTGIVTTPVVARSRGELARGLAQLRGARQPGDSRTCTVAFVPTMGALHEGHRALLRRARELADAVVVSIFVNPLQFGPGEDLDCYPRTFDADLAMCAAEGVTLVFAPSPDVVYPEEPVVTVAPGWMGEVLEGAHRPGHFAGVLTVVLKLLHLVHPDVAVFGEKDAQQLALVRRMVVDLDLPVHVVGVPTVREPDGLALSSRNRQLGDDQRRTALALSRGLRAGAAAAADGAPAIVAAARAVLDAEPALRVDYCALVDPQTFVEVGDVFSGAALLVVAARVGATRLIDNMPVTVAAS